MLFIALLFSCLWRQTSGYLQKSFCSDLTFGKCSSRNYCGITDTGTYTCLPCPAGKLCPGDGYIYHEQQLNNKLAKYIILTSNNSYIVSSVPANRKLFRKKLKKIIKIAKIGLKVAVIAKTGGTAGLAKLAAAKAKQLAIKKGIQCLKNGLSNFCNGKKKGAKLKPKAKPRLGGLVKKTKLPSTHPSLRRRGPKTFKPKPSKTNSLRKGKRNGRQPSKNVVIKPPSSNDDSAPCSNIFDDFANKVNNVTNNVVKNPVNKGRDWLKKNIGGNRKNCNQPSLRRRPTNLRGQTKKTKPTTITKRRPTTITKKRPTITKSKPRPRVPTSNDDTTTSPVSNDDTTSAPNSNDDSISTPKTRPATKSRREPKTKTVTNRPPSTDDTTVLLTRQPTRQTRRPTQNIISTDDSRARPSGRPTEIYISTDDRTPMLRPSRRPIKVRTNTPTAVRTNRPTRVPTRIPSTRSTFVLTIGPTRIPTIRPTRTPTPVPSRAPSVNPSPVPSRAPTARPTLLPSAAIAGPPTMIPGISWAVFSSAPTVKSNIPPTFIPTISMFTMTTAPPTIGSTVRATPAPSLLKVVVSQQASPTQRPNAAPPTAQPGVEPTITPSFRPTPPPTVTPTQEFITTFNPTIANGLSSINSASNGQTNNSQMIIGVGVGCLILVIIIIGACIFVSRKKQSPYQIWSNYYAKKPQEKQINSNEDIHHFYSKSPRPSFNQNTVFIPHVSGRITSRNSQIVSPIGFQKNGQRLSFTRGPALHNNF